MSTATSSNEPSGSTSAGESDFETAIEACGVGCFNVCLIIASLTTAISVIYTTSSLSFIFPTAECDLHLTLMDKGYLNAVSFAGMIISAIPWGYVADTMGRKIVLVYALILDGLVVICCGISQTLTQLLVFKFLDGFLICGPFAVIMSYVSEFHGVKHRARVLMILGMNFSAATMILPILAIFILPRQFISSQLYTWHIFLLATAVIPLIGGILNIFFPESPKFLMSQGRNAEALECLRTIYSINHRKPKSDYPIKLLQDEDPAKTQQHLKRSSKEYKEQHKSLTDKRQLAKEKFIEGLQQLRPMCSRDYIKQSLQIYTMFFCILLGLNSIRLWLPQVFVTLEEFESNNLVDHTSMCSILEHHHNKTTLLKSEARLSHCNFQHIGISSYIDNLYVAIASFLFYLLATVVINKLGNNMVLKISLCLAFVSGILMYFAVSRVMILTVTCVYVAVICVGATTIIFSSVNLFPTQMRTMVIIMMMTFGRFGSLLGNILFPLLISVGCAPPFLLIAGIITVSFVLSLFLPNPTRIALK